jgi:putative ABC transport system ATP-binding protein
LAQFFSIDHIEYRIGPDNRTVNVSACLEEGSILVIKGPSGSGKTTLLKILARLRECDQGQVSLQGVDWLSFSPQLWRSKINYAAQKPAVFSGTVLDNIKRPFELKIKKDTFNLHEAEEGLRELLFNGNLLHQDAHTLSGGETARIALLRSVLYNPDILLLDEPFASLDDNSAKAAMAFLKRWLLRKTGRGIVMVTHNDIYKEFTEIRILEIELPGPEVNLMDAG